MRKIQIGFLGCGNIGGGVWALLDNMRDDIARCYRAEVCVKRMLVRALDEPRRVPVALDRLTTDVEDILSDPDISIVCEFMGGEQPAAAYMLRALEGGKSVVTANKMALSLHWNALHAAARKGRARLLYEAAVCGAIPVMRTVREGMSGNRVDSISGILNGTTNYILTQMEQRGLSLAAALQNAQALGLAEPDPTSDVGGYDAAYKLSILASECFGGYIAPGDIPRQGIEGVRLRDMRAGERLGMRLKLIARARYTAEGVYAAVGPAFVPMENQLAGVGGAFNGVTLRGHACGDIFLYGRGAGAEPTAGAIVADILQAAGRPGLRAWRAYAPLRVLPGEEIASAVLLWGASGSRTDEIAACFAAMGDVRALEADGQALAAVRTAPMDGDALARALMRARGQFTADISAIPIVGG